MFQFNVVPHKNWKMTVKNHKNWKHLNRLQILYLEKKKKKKHKLVSEFIVLRNRMMNISSINVR